MRYIHPSLAKILIFFFIFPFSFVLISCSDSSTEPPPKPAGYQEDIPWPSLADSPWPMYRHDPQNTGRTNYTGPISGEVEWSIDSIVVGSGAAIDQDSTVYFVVTRSIKPKLPYEAGLVALNSNGDLKWMFPISPTILEASHPIISSTGVIYFTSRTDKKLYAINKSGSLNWVLSNINVNATCKNIGKDGTIYLIENQVNLFAIDPTGKISWTMNNLDIWGDNFKTMAFSPDGESLYLPGLFEKTALVAVDIKSQTVKWSFGKKASQTPIVVDYIGNIYLIADNVNDESSLFSLDKNGKINWEFSLKDDAKNTQWGYQMLSIDKKGNLFIGNDTVYCIDYRGQLQWKYGLMFEISTPGSIDAHNTLYFDSRQDYSFKLIALTGNGSLLFNLDYPFSARTGYSFAIGFSQKMYLPTWRSIGFSAIK